LDYRHYQSLPSENYLGNFNKHDQKPFPTLASIGFKSQGNPFPTAQLDETILTRYSSDRDFPAIQGTSRMGLHLRFGTVSIRKLVQKALLLNETYLNELIWRDFYHAILWQFPYINKGQPFKPEYDKIVWNNNETEFESWCKGYTGYPLVDAGMRELNETGFMHNRVRMVVASFLSKHLMIDWRWGEAYFAKKLLDYDFAANNGGWQWAAGCGCDAAPYFRVFNPTLQAQKFDPGFQYIRKWLPEFDTKEYCLPIINHEFARKRALSYYAAALKS
jgi:deoxyribodipyrimidine photo-lyase